MSPSKYSLGVRGIRSGRWSESKWTNENRFSPAHTEIGNTIDKYYDEIYGTPGLTVIVLPTQQDFLMPVDESSIRETLDTVPEEFTTGLAAIIVLSGSKKQEKTFRKLFAYGRYFRNIIVLHPFPRKFMKMHYRTKPKPSVMKDYERAGAAVSHEGRDWWVRFDETSLKQIYLRDVLLHELGHHVDADNLGSKSHRKKEGFAEWFASEYGFKLWRRETI